MMILVSYDVSTVSAEGRSRLRKVAKACVNQGQRVQNSVFECCLDYGQWTKLKHQLLELIKPEEDSIRFYYLGNKWEQKREHHGTKTTVNIETDTLFA